MAEKHGVLLDRLPNMRYAVRSYESIVVCNVLIDVHPNFPPTFQGTVTPVGGGGEGAHIPTGAGKLVVPLRG